MEQNDGPPVKIFFERLRASDTKILRRIYVSIYSRGHWRNRYNYELQSSSEDMDMVTLIRED
jgi:hypothetical protein